MNHTFGVINNSSQGTAACSTAATTFSSLKQACEISGLTYEILKFYCNKGIVHDVPRNANNHRVFTEEHIHWLKIYLA